MLYQFSPYILPLVLALAVSVWIVYYAAKNRNTRGAIFLSTLAATISIWIAGYILEISAVTLAAKTFWGQFEYIGITFVPVFWFVFTFLHTHKDRTISRVSRLVLSVIPIITILLAFSTQYHGLIWRTIGLFQTGNFSALNVTHGSWFWVHTIYSYGLLLSGSVFIIRSLGMRSGKFRAQTVALLIAVASPWIGNAIYLSGISPIPFLDLTPFSFTITLVALTWGIMGLKLIDLSPMARDFVIEHMKDGVIVFEATGSVTDTNPAARAILGIQDGMQNDIHIAKIFAQHPALMADLIAGKELLGEHLIAGEPERWFEFNQRPLVDRSQKKLGSVLTVHDITERKRTEERMSQLYRAVEASPTSIVITNTEAEIEYVNPKFTQVTGYSLSEIIGQNPRILKSGLTSEKTYIEMWNTLIAGQEWHGEFCNRKKNGEHYWELASISPISAPNGQITHYVAVKEDITLRKQSQVLLLQSEARYRQIVENASDLIFRANNSGLFEYVNPPTLHFLGYPYEQALLGKHYSELVAPDHREEVSAFYRNQIEKRILNTYHEFPAVLADGSLAWLGQNVQLICDGDVVTGFQAVARDITARKRTEEALALSRDQAVEASQLKSQLLAKVTHELRTPLGAILGFAELMRYGSFGPMNEKQNEASSQIIENGQFLNQMVNELLDEAQLSAQKTVLHVAPISLALFLAQVEAAMAILANRKGLELAFSTAPDMPAEILGDEGRLRQILVNIVGNAIKFTTNGWVRVNILRMDQTRWSIRVSDSGIGIPEQSLKAIFEPFHQVQNNLISDARGTGLGLTITKQLVELMGGKIMVESKPGFGSTFTVTLPLSDPSERIRGKTSSLHR